MPCQPLIVQRTALMVLSPNDDITRISWYLALETDCMLIDARHAASSSSLRFSIITFSPSSMPVQSKGMQRYWPSSGPPTQR